MEIRWTNFFGFLLGVFGLVILLRHRASIGEFLGTMAHITGHDASDRTLGLVAFAVVVASLIGMVRILTRNGRD